MEQMQHSRLQALLHSLYLALYLALLLQSLGGGLLGLTGALVGVHDEVSEALQEALLCLGDRTGSSSRIESRLAEKSSGEQSRAGQNKAVTTIRNIEEVALSSVMRITNRQTNRQDMSIPGLAIGPAVSPPGCAHCFHCSPS